MEHKGKEIPEAELYRVCEMGETATKRCYKCGETYPATSEFFHRNRARKDGLCGECKECRRECSCEAVRKWRQNNPERYREYNRQWYRDNPERAREYERRWRGTPQNRFVDAFTNYISQSLNGSRNRRPWQDLVGYSKEDLFNHMESQFDDGMTWDDYGDGPGHWQLHHIRPVSTFDFESPDDVDFHECWALGNIVSLWYEDHKVAHAEMRERK